MLQFLQHEFSVKSSEIRSRQKIEKWQGKVLGSRKASGLEAKVSHTLMKAMATCRWHFERSWRIKRVLVKLGNFNWTRNQTKLTEKSNEE